MSRFSPQMRTTEAFNFAETNSEDVLDSILATIGRFGRYELSFYMFFCIPLLFVALHTFSYVFTASPVLYRCKNMSCENNTEFTEFLTNFSILSEYDKCSEFIFDPAREHRYILTLPDCYTYFKHHIKIDYSSCVIDSKLRNVESTAATEFGLHCSEPWRISRVVSVKLFGQLIGLPIGGFISDKFGRKKALVISGLFSSIMGIIRSFSVNYFMFLSFEMLESVFGSMFLPTAVLLAIESVDIRRRSVAGAVVTIICGLGEALIAVVAEAFTNWRILLRVLYIPAALQMRAVFSMQESIRWQLSHGDEQLCSVALRKMARANRLELPRNKLRDLVSSNQAKFESDTAGRYPIWLGLTTYYWKIFIAGYCWCMIAVAMTLNFSDLSSDKYENFVYTRLMQIPGLILSIIAMQKISRPNAMCFSIILLCILESVKTFCTMDDKAIQIVMFIFGEYCIGCCFQILYLITCEMFPTNVGNTLLSISLMFGRLGAGLMVPIMLGLRRSSVYIAYGVFIKFAVISMGLLKVHDYVPKRTLPLLVVDGQL